MFSTDDTIVAVATPPGRGGLGVVRLSGPSAESIARRLVGRADPLRQRHATLARVREIPDVVTSRTIDEVVLTWFAAPHSYTGEDVVELSGHGSPVLIERIVELAIREGARQAEPGEFTFRAYLNGRMDLVQAEAVADLIHAVTPAQARVAMDQMDGTLTQEIRRVGDQLFGVIAKCEASLDFPDEGFHFFEAGELRSALNQVAAALDKLLSTSSAGRLLREGCVVVLSGRPNTGKSSLFNALLGRNRAIVTEVAGTTRDLISERVDFHGVPVTLVDTAGIRQSADPIELLGVKLAHEAVNAAEINVVVVDGSQPLTQDDRAVLAASAHSRQIVVVNKCDQPQAWAPATGAWAEESVVTSTVDGVGLDALKRRIVGEIADEGTARDTPTLTNIRHIGLIESARQAVDRAIAALGAGATEELLLIDLHDARGQLEEVTGRRTIDDVLRHIFSSFCIGK